MSAVVKLGGHSKTRGNSRAGRATYKENNP
jgi:hypothetical protein